LGGGVDPAEPLGQREARSASARSARKRLGCQPSGGDRARAPTPLRTQL
jgi:hypothetical protein